MHDLLGTSCGADQACWGLIRSPDGRFDAKRAIGAKGPTRKDPGLAPPALLPSLPLSSLVRCPDLSRCLLGLERRVGLRLASCMALWRFPAEQRV